MKTLLPLLVLATAPAFAAPAPSEAPAGCPDLTGQLSEYLASAKQRIGREGDVRVEFDVDAAGHTRLVAMQGTRSYRAPVRIAMESLDCRAGAPQRYVLNIRFADPLPRVVATAASATVAQALPTESR
ncbi:hypothetical protein LXT12_09760 [Pelomonas sp. P7]|uniref:Uncharacterized protein n=1 Tax=Pelomonas caseinilytica TaxID=2906763 RepID=A0ABS8X9K5_9BURK|nr:hypothetical protein [Pelomonas sp. P7]MCE4537534.1 hypothetical protein [Pelomonas sp. P7]